MKLSETNGFIRRRLLACVLELASEWAPRLLGTCLDAFVGLFYLHGWHRASLISNTLLSNQFTQLYELYGY